MSTGATPEQIEAAAKRYWQYAMNDPHGGFMIAMGWANAAAQYMVPPDHRIIGPEQIEALRSALGAAASANVMSQSDFDILFPLIEDAS